MMVLLTLLYIPLYNVGVIGRAVNVGEISIPKWNYNPFLPVITNTVIDKKNGWVRCVTQNGCVADYKLYVYRSMYQKIGVTSEKP